MPHLWTPFQHATPLERCVDLRWGVLFDQAVHVRFILMCLSFWFCLSSFAPPCCPEMLTFTKKHSAPHALVLTKRLNGHKVFPQARVPPHAWVCRCIDCVNSNGKYTHVWQHTKSLNYNTDEPNLEFVILTTLLHHHNMPTNLAWETHHQSLGNLLFSEAKKAQLTCCCIGLVHTNLFTKQPIFEQMGSRQL